MKGSSTKKALSRAELDQLARIAALPDEQIDTSDIPEAPIENWARAKRGDFYRTVKRSVTIRLDADVLAWLKEHAAGGRYQTEINRILRRYVIDAEKRRGMSSGD
ncbi:MAG TPA: BrnA antitoxin family protein [Roseiarcus sp.]|nr:BrnA antitoxin family protein [Roseiarcus sp.]